MRRVIKRYRGYELEFLFEPGGWMTDRELLALKSALDHVNQISARPLRYGIFDPSNGLEATRDFLSSANLCLMHLDGEPVGLFNNVILQRSSPTAIHAGLIMIARNTGVDLMRTSAIYMTILQRRKYGSYYYTNISAIPFSIGVFCDVFRRAWPSYRSPMARPPGPDHLRMLDLLYKEYVQRYFPGDGVAIDRKRFVLRSPVDQMGFEPDIRKLPRHPKLQANLFCMFWLDYSRGEDLIQIGKVDSVVGFKVVYYVVLLKLSEWLRNLFVSDRARPSLKSA